MGIKLELLLIIAITGIIAGTLILKLRDTPVAMKVLTKEIEFTNTTLTEVDTNNMKGRIETTHGISEKDLLTLDNIVYTSDSIESLSANQARMKGDFLLLDGDVVLHEKGGYKYYTQHAVYNKQTEILHITSPFKGVKGQNVVHGESMEYNLREKKAIGTTVGTIIYTPDK